MSHLKSIQENIEKVPDNTPSVNGSVLGSIKPGEQLTPEQKEKLAKENAAETAEAQRLAAEHRARDMAEGKGEPVVAAVAGALKEKLQNEEFQTKEATTPAPEVPPAA